ncbi:MAG: hypothetical protein F6K31_34880 [Symploca sp. SIO2G7]|nr:hypothetical protein [Symploca sp. SIO2G7]
MMSTSNAHQASCQYSPKELMTATLFTPTTVIPKIQWEKLPADFILPDDPVENIYQPIMSSCMLNLERNHKDTKFTKVRKEAIAYNKKASYLCL